MSATIIIAEDNRDIRELLAIRLEEQGFHCLRASDGIEVLRLLLMEKVDLVLMDMCMPTLDGWQTILKMRLSELHSDIPVIAVSAFSLAGDKARAASAGCNAYHCKPVDFDSLFSDIHRLLSGQQSHTG